MHPLCARDIDATEPWLDQVPGNVALSGLIDAAMLAESLLIDEAVRRGPIDRRRVCLIVQHVACGASEWTAATRRMADKLDVKLAPTVREEMNGASLHREIGQLDGTYAESTRPRDAS
ncbi:hypothetical protein [Pinirhizobacter sp.]|jgi:hypothetical protein|uniref:hypothetical protein n=1 Tax=Pinirhizobacter sp. TaxID=2950432 RepID=UPI002F3FF020